MSGRHGLNGLTNVFRGAAGSYGRRAAAGAVGRHVAGHVAAELHDVRDVVEVLVVGAVEDAVAVGVGVVLRLLAAALCALALALAGCGGDDDDGGSGTEEDPVAQVPSGLQEQVRAAQDPQESDFPATDGRTLQELADAIGGGPEMGLAGSIFLAGRGNRVAFGVIDDKAGFVYGKTGALRRPSPNAARQGPVHGARRHARDRRALPLPAGRDEADPFAAVYAAQVPFDKPGDYAVMAVTLVNGKPVAAPGQLK